MRNSVSDRSCKGGVQTPPGLFLPVGRGFLEMRERLAIPRRLPGLLDKKSRDLYNNVNVYIEG